MNRDKYMKILISIEKDTFSVDELNKLAQCIRDIEQNKPERHINILIDSPDKTVKEMEELMSSIEPGFPYKKIIKFDNDKT